MTPVQVGISEGVATLQLMRPERMNALDEDVFRALHEGLDMAEAEDVGCVIITGTGKAFSAGQNLNADLPCGQEGHLDLGAVIERDYNPLVRRLRAFPRPVIAAVNGAAVGAGANLALACDIVLAARSAYFMQAFVRIGLIPDAGGTWLLPRIVGSSRALAMMLTGDAVDAATAERYGLVYQVFDDSDLLPEAQALASRLAQGPRTALSAIKQAMAHSLETGLDPQLDYERDNQHRLGRTADFHEGVAAFRQKRSPRFKA